MRIYDEQLGKFFWGGHIFKTRKEAREALIDYHKLDNDYQELRKMTLNELLTNFEWRLEEDE